VVAGASGRPFPRLPTRAAVIAQRRRGQRPTGVSASAASAAPPPGEAAGPRCVRWSAASASAAPGNGAFSMIKYIHFLIQAGKRYPRACRNQRGLAERQPAPAGRMAPAAEWTARAPLGRSERQAGRRQQQAGGRACSDCRPARRSGRAAVWTARAPWRGSAVIRLTVNFFVAYNQTRDITNLAPFNEWPPAARIICSFSNPAFTFCLAPFTHPSSFS
jgi:hypothetical protein